MIIEREDIKKLLERRGIKVEVVKTPEAKEVEKKIEEEKEKIER